MPHRRTRSDSVEPQNRFDFGGNEPETRIAPAFATLCLGGFALLVTGAAWTGPLGWLAWFDLPLAFALFGLNAWISLIDPRQTARAMPGLLASAAAVTLAVIHLFASPEHPWMR